MRERAEPGAGGEQAGGFTVDQLHVVGFGDADFADALQLQQLALHHHLGEVDQQVENREATLAQGYLERLHIEPVAGQHGGMIAPHHIDRRASAPRLGHVDYVVMHQGRGVDHFHDSGHANQAWIGFAEQSTAQQDQDRAQTLASAGLQILPDIGDRVDGSNRLQTDLALHLVEVGANQIEDLERGQGLANLAECHEFIECNKARRLHVRRRQAT